MLEIFMNKMETCQSTIANRTKEITSSTAIIARLEAELKAAKIQAENELSLIREFSAKIDAQQNETFFAKLEELSKMIEMKNRQNEELSHELKRRNAEINNKTMEIKSLKEKIATLSSD